MRRKAFDHQKAVDDLHKMLTGIGEEITAERRKLAVARHVNSRLLLDDLRKKQKIPPEFIDRASVGIVRSALAAVYQRYYRSGANPVHAWEAIWTCTNPQTRPQQMPDWCLDYLWVTADLLLDLAVGDRSPFVDFDIESLKNPSKAIDRVPQALGFVVERTNYIKNYRSELQKVRDRLAMEALRDAGHGYEEALDILSQPQEENQSHRNPDATRKSINAGKDLLNSTPDEYDALGRRDVGTAT